MSDCKSVFKLREIAHRVCQNTLAVCLHDSKIWRQ